MTLWGCYLRGYVVPEVVDEGYSELLEFDWNLFFLFLALFKP